MGVPSLFRWFEKKFPGVVRKPDSSVDTCDNLYVDANSIIHNVCHPTHRPPPSTEEQMMVEIEAYLTHVIKTAQPSKLVFIAIDGVAPQAKILQQRARRFRAAKEAKELNEKKAKFIKDAREQKIYRYDKLAGADNWDSNAITPGTPFMAALDRHLHAWILRKFKTDPYFQPLTIILSGSGVPGEGEHKAMDFIRRQRCQPGYKPLKHAFYGPDADLILLALATHEPSFRILREDPREKVETRCVICQTYAFGQHSYKKCPALPEDWSMPDIKDNAEFIPPRLIFFDVWLLRIALETYLKLPATVQIKTEGGEAENQPLYNHERGIDDFILIVALMGNDFIPGLPLPNWDIHEGAINVVVDAWQRSTINQKGYITKNGKIRLDRLENLFRTLAPLENFPPEIIDESARYPSLAPKKDSATPDIRGSSVASFKPEHANSHLFARYQSTAHHSARNNDTDSIDLPEGFPALASSSKAKEDSPGLGGVFEAYREDEANTEHYEFFDTKMTYYEKKLGFIEAHKPGTVKDMARKYVEGLQWVMEYYCQGCPSWKWYYPYHYAPWPSDFVHLHKLKITFKMSSPLPPFSQLMSVFPPASAEHVPRPYRHFMLDPASPIRDYYPEDFKTDRNGKAQEWKSVVLLAHINPRRLQETLQPIWEQRAVWNAEERERNRLDAARIYVCDQEQTKKLFQRLYTQQNDPRRADQVWVEVTYAETGSLAGKIGRDHKLAEAEEYNKQFDHQNIGHEHNKGPKIRSISAVYAVPHQITPHSYVLLPHQPEVHFHYKLVARFKRDPERKIQRAWPQGDNAGRDAREVAREIATGLRPDFVDWTAKFGMPEEDAVSQPFEPLPASFDDFILPDFPMENETFHSFAAMDLDEDEDEEAFPELQVQAGSSKRTSTSRNPFNRTTILSKRGREAGPSTSALTAAGYTKIVEHVVKDELMSEDSDDDDEEEREKRKKKHAAFFKKQKPSKGNSAGFTVPKREESSDEGWA